MLVVEATRATLITLGAQDHLLRLAGFFLLRLGPALAFLVFLANELDDEAPETIKLSNAT